MYKVVSVIVPIYNQEKNLDFSIPAIQKQDWVNVEIVAVNDGSTDNSERILEKYRNNDNRIKIINKKNGGLADAIRVGIENASGEYICFVDPDDLVCENYVSLFMNYIDDCDFIAMGYYENNGKRIIEHRLEKDNYYNFDDIQELKNRYLYSKERNYISKEIFIARWNKCYKTDCLKRMLNDLKLIVNVSLGEDTIFTYIMLNFVGSGKTISIPNSYIYNTDSQTSMMKNGAAKINLEKAKVAYNILKMISSKYGNNDEQAVMLYYFLVNCVFDRLRKMYDKELIETYNYTFRKDNIYIQAIKKIQKEKVFPKNIVIRNAIFFYLYNNKIKGIYNDVKSAIGRRLKEPKSIINDIIVNEMELNKAIQLSKFRKQRYKAVDDMNIRISEIEKQIMPYLEKWISRKSDLSKCEISKNIFVFW